MRDIPRVFISPDSAHNKASTRNRPSLLDLSEDDIYRLLEDLEHKLSNPIFYSRYQLRGMRKARQRLETRLDDILDDKVHQEWLRRLSRKCVSKDIEAVRRSEGKRVGKSELKAKSGGYRIRPGPKRYEKRG